MSDSTFAKRSHRRSTVQPSIAGRSSSVSPSPAAANLIKQGANAVVTRKTFGAKTTKEYTKRDKSDGDSDMAPAKSGRYRGSMFGSDPDTIETESMPVPFDMLTPADKLSTLIDPCAATGVSPFIEEPDSLDVFAEHRTLFPGHSDSVHGVATDAASDRVYSASWDGTVMVWNAFTRERLGTLPHSDWVNAVVIVRIRGSVSKLAAASSASSDKGLGSKKGSFGSQDGSQMSRGSGLSGGDGACNAVPMKDALLSGPLLATHVVTGCEDGAVTFWSPAELTVIHQVYPGHSAITSLSVAADLVFATALYAVYVISAVTGSVLRELIEKSDANCTVFGQELLYVGYHDCVIRGWDVADVFVARELIGHSGPIRDVVAVPQNNLLYSASDDCSIRSWALSTGSQMQVIKTHTKPVRTLAVYHGLRYRLLLSGSLDGSIAVTGVQGDVVVSRPIFGATPNCIALKYDSTDIANIASASMVGGGSTGMGGAGFLSGRAVLIVGDYRGTLQQFPMQTVEAAVSADLARQKELQKASHHGKSRDKSHHTAREPSPAGRKKQR